MSSAELLARLRRPRSAPKCCLDPTVFIPPDFASYTTFDENSLLDRERRAMSARRSALPSTLPVRRRPKTSQAVREDERQLFREARSGYTIKRSRSRVDVVIQPDRFFTNDDAEQLHRITPRANSASVPRTMTEQDELMEQLEERVGQLALFLEEEKANHRETRSFFTEKLSSIVEELQSNHRSEVASLEKKQKEETEELVNSHKKQVDKLNQTYERERRQFLRDIESVQAQFESYKTQLHIETAQRLKDHETRVRNEYESQTGAFADQFKARVREHVELATEQLKRDMDTRLGNLRRDHKREMDDLYKKFGDSVSLAQKTQVIEKELEKRNAEFETLQQKHDQLVTVFDKTQVDLLDAKEELNNWRSRFDQKVKEVDASYCEQIEELKRRLYDTKAAYIDKCAVLHRERVQHEEQIEVRATSAKNMMKQVIQSRIRTEMPLTAGQELVDVNAEIRKTAHNYTLLTARRNSAPGSLQEEKRAYVSIAQLSEQSKKTPR